MGEGVRDRQRLLEELERDLRAESVEPIAVTASTGDGDGGPITVYYQAPLPGEGELLDVEVARALRVVDAYLSLVQRHDAEDLAWRPASLEAGVVDPDREKAVVWSLPARAAREFVDDEIDVLDLLDRLGESATYREDVVVDDGEVSFGTAGRERAETG